MKPDESGGTSRNKGNGKQQLIAAALRLAAQKRSFRSVGLRELAREAGLNPNTFYRHFSSMDELGVCLVQLIGSELKGALEQAMARQFEPRDLIDQALDQLFAFSLAHPDAILVAACERYSSSPAVREALEQMLESFRQDVSGVAQALGALEILPVERVDEITGHIIHYCFRIIVDYLEKPDQRDDIKRAARRYVIMLFSGALSLEQQRRATSGV